jgi:hypothetical protein
MHRRSPAYELWRARGSRPLVRLSDAAGDGDLLIRTQTLADILGTRIILYRVPFSRPAGAPPWPEDRREFLHYAEPMPEHFVR